MIGAWDGGKKKMTLVEIAVIILIIFDIYIFKRLELHEAAIAELLKKFPDLADVIDGESDE